MASGKNEPEVSPPSTSNSNPPLASLPIAAANRDIIGSRTLYDVWVHRFGSHLEQNEANNEASTLSPSAGFVTSTGTFSPL